MKTVDLQAKPRTTTGQRKARALRRAETIPAIVYGHGMKPLSLEVSERALSRILHTKAGANVMVSLQVEGVKLKESTCRIKDIQHNPITDQIDHVDFMVISMTEKITVKVPAVLKHADEAIGVKEEGVLDRKSVV